MEDALASGRPVVDENGRLAPPAVDDGAPKRSEVPSVPVLVELVDAKFVRRVLELREGTTSAAFGVALEAALASATTPNARKRAVQKLLYLDDDELAYLAGDIVERLA